MQIFNREPATCNFYNKYNIAIGSGNTFVDLAEVTMTIPDVIFAGIVYKTRWYNSENLAYIYFVCSRQLTTEENSFIERRWNSTSGYEVTSTFVMNYIPPTYNFRSGGSGDAIRMWDYWTNDEILKANNTRGQRETHIYYFSSAMTGGANPQPVQTDYICTCDGVPMFVPDGSVPTASDNVTQLLAFGRFWRGVIDGNWDPRLTISGVYEIGDDYWTRYEQSTSRALNYSEVQWWYLWVMANGNLDYDFDYDTPFNPLPTDFYITVNCQTDGVDKGEQSLTFSWTPQNIEELDIDLEAVSLHFAFTMSPDYTYTNVVPYSSEPFATSYKSICEEMGVPWWRNIINKLPLPSQEINTTMYCDIWWSTPAGNAGVCQYIIKYDGTNIIGTEKAKDPATELWTYLTANEGTDSQDYDPDPNPYDDLSDFGGGTDAVNGSALLTTSYGLSVSGAHDFGNWLWGTGLDLAQLKMVVNNPIENIVACKLFPFSVTGTASTVKLGNVSSPVSAYLLPENVARTFDAGDVAVPKKYNSFLDYAPYTNVRIYLPYLGLHEIETDVVMGNTINVKYYVDLVTGHCRAIIFLKDGNTLKKIQQIDGMMGQDVPVVGSNRAQVEAGYIVGGAQAVASFAGGIGNAIMGNVGSGIADIGSAIKGGLQTAMQQYHTYTSGTPSPALSRFDEQKVCVFVDRPVYTEPVLTDKKTDAKTYVFRHQNGLMCNLACCLNELSGYTVIDNTVDLSSIPCSKYERDELLKLLTSGIYL